MKLLRLRFDPLTIFLFSMNIIKEAKRLGIEIDLGKRWKEGIKHHTESEKLIEALKSIDFNICGDTFCWKTGGDGDNGEILMYQMDVYFEVLDALRKSNG